MAKVIADVWKGGTAAPFKAVRVASVLQSRIAPKPRAVAAPVALAVAPLAL
jgi:hypothetical protein